MNRHETVRNMTSKVSSCLHMCFEFERLYKIMFNVSINHVNCKRSMFQVMIEIMVTRGNCDVDIVNVHSITIP